MPSQRLHIYISNFFSLLNQHFCSPDPKTGDEENTGLEGVGDGSTEEIKDNEGMVQLYTDSHYVAFIL